MLSIGLLITFFFMWYWGPSRGGLTLQPLYILLYAILFGVVWDVGYMQIQKRRWDRDFPFGFQFIGGVVEGLLIYLLLSSAMLPAVDAGLPFSRFATHYGLIFISTFLFLLGPIKVIFPSWRYNGGEFGGF